jgi:hypothetical protein
MTGLRLPSFRCPMQSNNNNLLSSVDIYYMADQRIHGRRRSPMTTVSVKSLVAAYEREVLAAKPPVGRMTRTRTKTRARAWPLVAQKAVRSVVGSLSLSTISHSLSLSSTHTHTLVALKVNHRSVEPITVEYLPVQH